MSPPHAGAAVLRVGARDYRPDPRLLRPPHTAQVRPGGLFRGNGGGPPALCCSCSAGPDSNHVTGNMPKKVFTRTLTAAGAG